MTMREKKRANLKKAGWKFGSADEFLNLSPEETAYIDMKLSLSKKLKDRRIDNDLTQVELALAVNSSQSRIAKMEAGDPSVSIDLLVKSLLALGVSRKELGKTIS
jgi:DNA-binding XRE family transcriptional regulator